MVCDEESILRPKLTPCAFWYWPGSTTSKQDSGWGKSGMQRRQKSNVLVCLSSGLGPKPVYSLYCLPWPLPLNEPRQLSKVIDLYLLCLCFHFFFQVPSKGELFIRHCLKCRSMNSDTGKHNIWVFSETCHCSGNSYGHNQKGLYF